ncbi:ABC transporter permease [Mameliella sediminis]|uniref:ABC transporter permease n=1 Tax=Mameliella sediminis TaxID=2836866 RepID=UPI001C460FA2|nr:ABC transporter permease [Mameliella sediminis]MBY6115285.1 ABC transporter permease [Antarctobacter heliothermus]MBY6144650.1 ABC transporter permease [Mameliella alba]MBV7395764.1 ABC transporter permease [Mameliella sediminis]MBY6160177.1 ABC transporter permease [Mameliella alba]MBY6168647.1 ABC transporter permease [Mameliella alba]
MTGLILRRFGFAAFTIGFVSIIMFAAVEALPGNVCTAFLQRFAQGPRLERCIEQQGLDRSAIQRYGDWVTGAVQGDFGYSLKKRKPINELIGERFANTALLGGLAALLAIPLAIFLGIVAGVRRDRPADLTLSGLAMLAMTIPEFVTATGLIYVFAITLQWFPAVTIMRPGMGLMDMLPVIVLPVMVLSAVLIAHIMRMMRASVIDVMASDYVQMARLKGVPEREIIRRHVVPNAMIPALNVIALTIAWLLAGVVVVEKVFNYPGLGTLMIQAIHDRDLPLVQAIALIFSVIYVGVNLLADLAAVLIDPRLRRKGH